MSDDYSYMDEVLTQGEIRAGIDRYIDNVESLLIALAQRNLSTEQEDRLLTMIEQYVQHR